MKADPTSGEKSRAKRLRVILLTHGGAEEVLNRLLSPEVEVAGIFVETDIVRRYSVSEKIKRSIRYDGFATTAAKFARKLFPAKREKDELLALLQSRNVLEQIARTNGIPFHIVANYHSPKAMSLMRSAQPDLGVIYGTNIIKEAVFKIPHLGSINLHQGLAPYYRGGPPIFWELYNGESQVGLTVHFVESKVDSGAIILQETVQLKYDYHYGDDYDAFISSFCENLQVPSAELVAEAVHLIARGTATPKPQDGSLGKRYRLPLKADKDELRRRLRSRQNQCASDWTPQAEI